jgi:hypothetical protein
VGMIEILEVRPIHGGGDDLLIGFFDAPKGRFVASGYVFPSFGWVLGRNIPAVAIEFVSDGRAIKRAPINVRRPDVATSHPDHSTEHCGFMTAVGVLGLPKDFAIEVHVLFADDSRLAWQVIRGRRQPMYADYRPTMNPLLVTSSGRSGSTLLIQLLGYHPQVVCQNPYVDEARYVSYWAHMAKVLSEAGEFADPIAWAGDLQRLDSVRPNPFYFAGASVEPRVRDWLGSRYVENFATFCRRSCEEYYHRVAIAQGRTRTAYFAEKQSPGLIRDVARELYPETREIIAVRDFRDMLASMIAFLQKPRTSFVGCTAATPIETLIADVRSELMLLVNSWKQASKVAHLVRYEELVSQPQKVLDGIFHYLGIPASQEMLREMVQRAFANTSQFDYHRTTDSVESSIGRWRRDLTPELQALCQDAFREPLEAFGYPVQKSTQ